MADDTPVSPSIAAIPDQARLDRLPTRPKWSFGVLNDPETDDVPGTIQLISEKRTPTDIDDISPLPEVPRDASSVRSLQLTTERPASLHNASRISFSSEPDLKRTQNGDVILNPQPDDSVNDPLNWPAWKRDMALFSLGFMCMIGGGMTPILAAGFTQVAQTYTVTTAQVSLTTGCYMLGLGVGSVIFSPTAILYGKRPVYLLGGTLFVISAIWCAASPSYSSLVVARVFQGIAVSPVECLPSATISEIYFLHERAYRLGIYTLLLLGGKNLVPLVGAVIIDRLSWQWVFWIVAIVVGAATIALFLCLPETFWSRAPKLSNTDERQRLNAIASLYNPSRSKSPCQTQGESEKGPQTETIIPPPIALTIAATASDSEPPTAVNTNNDPEKQVIPVHTPLAPVDSYATAYTYRLSTAPKRTYLQTLRPFNGRLRADSWLKSAVRPFVLYTHPAILWSALVYSMSIGWLIVISQVLDTIYRGKEYDYNFTTLQAGLVYISPFVGGIFGTVVAGRASDIVVRVMAKRNGGVFEPEFRLVMGIPIIISTAIGLMGFGWAAQVHDAWIVPTVFFGVTAFGCTLGSTTAVTFAIDSYKAYAGEALVTLNFSKNVLHGFVFSLFFSKWVNGHGSRQVFLCVGGIQIACMLTTIPLYIYGKRMRMWTVRKNFMAKLL